MTLKKYILTLLFLTALTGTSQGQKKMAPAQKAPSTLERARSLKSKKPQEAIRLIESVIERKRSAYDPARDAEAYMLLGNIYEEIDQKEFAKQRYYQAAKILEGIKPSKGKTKDSYKIDSKINKLKAQNHLAIGLLEMDVGNIKGADLQFNSCLRHAADKATRLKCEVGKADLELLQKNYDKSIQIYDNLRSGYSQQMDSMTLSDLEAKKSQAFANKKDLDLAKESYINSINTFPSNVSDEGLYANIEQSCAVILDNMEDVEEKIALREDNVRYKKNRNFSRQSIISEQLELADLLLKKGEVEKAEAYINASKALLNNRLNTAQTAEVFKKAAEISQQKGSLSEANKDFQNFNEAIDRANQGKQQELEKKLEIFKEQANIDILDRDLKIEEKTEALLTQQLKNQRIVIGLLCLLLLLALFSFYFIMRNVRAKRKANAMLLLKSLRTQMNPHFIFNALNSVNNYIAKNDEKAANKFLSNFSRLMRMVLDYSQKDFISFEEEIHLIELYLQLEHARFRDKFAFSFTKDELPDAHHIEIPPMLIQPFIENAIWHGLRYKKEKGLLDINISQAENHLKITIVDDGIGREKSKALKTKNQKQYKSTGLKNVDKRIALINDLYAKNYKIDVKNAFPDKEDVGTFVCIRIPL